MKKIFHNAISYDNGGWFICEARDWPYKNKTNKQIFVTLQHPNYPKGICGVSDDPEVQAYLQEVKEVQQQLHDELVKVALDLKLNILDLDGNKSTTEVVLENDDGEKLTNALIALGWEKEFIPIGP